MRYHYYYLSTLFARVVSRYLLYLRRSFAVHVGRVVHLFRLRYLWQSPFIILSRKFPVSNAAYDSKCSRAINRDRLDLLFRDLRQSKKCRRRGPKVRAVIDKAAVNLVGRFRYSPHNWAQRAKWTRTPSNISYWQTATPKRAGKRKEKGREKERETGREAGDEVEADECRLTG